MQVQLGCFAYVFSEFPLEVALDAIARAGYRYVGLGLAPREAPVPNDQSGAAEGAAMRRRLEGVGLKGIFSFAPSPVGEGGIERFRRRIEFCQAAGVPFIVATGAWGYKKWPDVPFTPAEMEQQNAPFYAAFRELAPYAQEAGVSILLKPHTGSTATSKECLQTLRAIDHPAVRICYDAGNVRFYEGIAPEDDVLPLLPYVKGLCLKDHQGPRANPNFPVPGEGGVDHRLLFARLKEGGFSGPMVLERVDGTMKKAEMSLELTSERVARARRNVLAALEAVGASVE
ncbi:MAG: sugar phosphate isomerase/epimerase [Armatimonadota bacterium]|nr:sugar phosphate isomerase/epimerase [Armatimonadota bacterium]